MSVGTQSIRRAAEKAAEETSPNASGQPVAEEKVVESADAAEAKKTTAKTETKAAKKTTTKKSAVRKSDPVKTSVIPEVSPQTAEVMKLTGREHYQVNDELPIYLL